MIEYIRFAVAALLILAGTYFSIMSVLGTFKFKYVLLRMHSAAMGDTLSVLFILLGLIILCGWTFTSLKLAVLILFFWLASPVSGHLISSLVSTVDSDRVLKEDPLVEAETLNKSNELENK